MGLMQAELACLVAMIILLNVMCKTIDVKLDCKIFSHSESSKGRPIPNDNWQYSWTDSCPRTCFSFLSLLEKLNKLAFLAIFCRTAYLSIFCKALCKSVGEVVVVLEALSAIR